MRLGAGLDDDSVVKTASAGIQPQSNRSRRVESDDGRLEDAILRTLN